MGLDLAILKMISSIVGRCHSHNVQGCAALYEEQVAVDRLPRRATTAVIWMLC